MAVEFISLLVKRYPGPVATRALWQWAGGRDGDFEFAADDAAQWTALWGRAASGPVSRMALLREALFDSPGDPELLAAVDELADHTQGGAPAEVANALDALLAEGCEDAAVWICLAGVRPRGFDVSYAALLPALEGRLPAGARDLLDELLPRLMTAQAIPSFAAAADGIRKRLSSAPPGGSCPAMPAVRKLGRRLSALAEAPAEERAGLIASLLADLGPIAQGAPPEVSQVAAAVSRQLAFLEKLGDGRVAPLSELPRALRAALWSTRPKVREGASGC